jgi:hypothetical protein
MRAWMLALAVVGGCSGSDTITGTGNSTSQSIDGTGGSIALEGVTLQFPGGAVPSTMTISITSTTDSAPSDYTNRSPVYQFGPDGQTFGQPVTVTMAYVDDGQPVSLYWSNLSGGYDEIPATISNGSLTGTIIHFSKGFVGRHKPGPDAGPADAAPDATPVACATGQYVCGTICCSGTNQACVNGQCQISQCLPIGQICNIGTQCCTGFCSPANNMCGIVN